MRAVGLVPTASGGREGATELLYTSVPLIPSDVKIEPYRCRGNEFKVFNANSGVKLT